MSQRSDYWVALDGLRGVAVAAVLLYHFGAPVGSGGYLGVDLFFVISGCVVTTSLRRSLARGATIPDFFLRRAARLLPNLLLLLIAAAAWNAWADGRWITDHNRAVLTGLTQTANLLSYGDGQGTAHLWSLSAEWQFYLLLPFVLPALCGRGLSRGVRLALGVAAASIALRPILDYAFGVSLMHVYLWPITRLDDLMMGVAVALLVENKQRPAGRLLPRVLPLISGAAIAAALLVAPYWYRKPELSLFAIMPAVALAAFVLVWSLVSAEPGAPLNRLLATPALTYLGERSYSVYLWHYLIGAAVVAHGEGWHGDAVFARQVTLSLIVALIAYEAIERPVRLHANRWLSRKTVAPAPVEQAAPATLA